MKGCSNFNQVNLFEELEVFGTGCLHWLTAEGLVLQQYSMIIDILLSSFLYSRINISFS
jgi:hypothetical protein